MFSTLSPVHTSSISTLAFFADLLVELFHDNLDVDSLTEASHMASLKVTTLFEALVLASVPHVPSFVTLPPPTPPSSRSPWVTQLLTHLITVTLLFFLITNQILS